MIQMSVIKIEKGIALPIKKILETNKTYKICMPEMFKLR